MKFDQLVDSTLQGIYCEMIGQQTSALTSTEKDAVTDAESEVESNPIAATPEQKRLADLAKRRKQQLTQVAAPAAQKLQRVVSQPVQQ